MIRDIPIIALLTDFGTSDTYVGMMKGVILSICPTVQVIDLTHDISPQNIRQAAYELMIAADYMPAHCIYVVVVDPGVGSMRRAVAVETNRGIFVAPDNGVLSYVLAQRKIKNIVQLENYHLDTISSTFHGRDIFAPAGAHLAAGKQITEMGTSLQKLETLSPPVFEVYADKIVGEVLHIDHFGNIITSIGRLMWDTDDLLHLKPIFLPQVGADRAQSLIIAPESVEIEIRDVTIGVLALTYSGVARNTLLTLVSSAGQLEIAMNQGHAAHALNAQIGDKIVLYLTQRG